MAKNDMLNICLTTWDKQCEHNFLAEVLQDVI